MPSSGGMSKREDRASLQPRRRSVLYRPRRGNRRSFCPTGNGDRFVESDEMVFRALFTVVACQSGLLNDSQEVAAVQVAEHLSFLEERGKWSQFVGLPSPARRDHFVGSDQMIVWRCGTTGTAMASASMARSVPSPRGASQRSRRPTTSTRRTRTRFPGRAPACGLRTARSGRRSMLWCGGGSHRLRTPRPSRGVRRKSNLKGSTSQSCSWNSSYRCRSAAPDWYMNRRASGPTATIHVPTPLQIAL